MGDQDGDSRTYGASVGVGNLPHPYLECVDCFQTINDPPVEGLIEFDEENPF